MIELAKPEDLVQIYALSTASYLETNGATTSIAIHMDKSLVTIASCINNGLCFVDRNEENPKLINGLVMFTPTAPWFSTDMVYTSLMFYVKPEFRTFKLAKSLLSSAKECAIISKIPLAFDLFTQKDADKKKRLFKYLGFEEWGSSYLYIPK